jgi:hypothetical protein
MTLFENLKIEVDVVLSIVPLILPVRTYRRDIANSFVFVHLSPSHVVVVSNGTISFFAAPSEITFVCRFLHYSLLMSINNVLSRWRKG